MTPKRLPGKIKGERPQAATSMCVNVCIFCDYCTGNYVRAPLLLRLQSEIAMSVLRVRLQISRGERRVAVQAGRSRTESIGRQNHAEVSQAEIPVEPLTES